MEKIDWRSPDSEGAKRELIGKDWGSEVDTYLWYEIGESRFDEFVVKAIVSEFFVHGNAGFGDVEFHQSSELPGGPMLLRLRGKLRLYPALTISGRYCPLYQVGHGGSFSGKPTEDYLNFFRQWELGEQH